MELDCTDYNDNIKCPKQLQIKKKEIKSNFLNVIMTGCWGVYCWDGEKTLIKYNDKGEYNDDNNTNTFFEEYKKQYGSKRVVKGLIKYTHKIDTQAVFLAGDNVYGYEIPKELLIKLVDSRQAPTKEIYKLDSSISSQDIIKQLHEGFVDCFNKVNVKDFYVAIGNHDIATCYDLNQQLEFAKNHPEHKYRLPGVYYNVIYKMKGDFKVDNFKVNFIVIDTNMFEEKPINCSGKKYDNTEMIKTQTEWVLDTLIKNNCLWNIIIGHIPYKSNLHKKNKNKNGPNFLLNKNLDNLFKLINNQKYPKVQAYFCADEHNQQFLYDKTNNMSLIIAGSGGTPLDKNLIEGDYREITKFYSNNFGFVSFNFKKNILKIVYFNSISLDLTMPSFKQIVNTDGTLGPYIRY